MIPPYAKRLIAAIPILATCAGVSAAVPVPADAGVYTVHHCRTPAGGAASVDDWLVVERTGPSEIANACPHGPLTVRLTPNIVHTFDNSVRIQVDAPANTDIRSYALYRRVTLGPRYNFWRFEYPTAGPVETCLTTSGSCSSLGTPVHVNDRSGTTGLALYLTCGDDDTLGTLSTSCVAASPAAELQLQRAELTLFDRHAPRIEGNPTGSLVEPASELIGTHSARIAASDLGSGVYRGLVEVDGEVVSSAVLDDNGGRCAEPFTTVAPCRLSATGLVRLDTARLADGPHLLRLLATDATGTNVGEWGPIPIETSNGACNPSPRVGGATLSAAFRVKSKGKGKGKGKRSRTSVVTSHGRRLEVRGKLVRDGSPVPGARVCVASRAERTGASLRNHGAATTGADGRFSMRIPGGPSRSVYAVHRVARGAIVDRLRVHVKARVSLKPSRRRLANGGRVVLSGKLLHGPIPDRGLLVQLQARRSSGWHTFGTARTDRHGRYEFGYRFTRTTGLQRYQLRALIAPQSAYPYAKGASKRIVLTVSG